MPESSLSPSTERAIDRFCDDWIVREGAPGGSLAVFDRGGIRYAEGYGARELNPTEPATPETLYYAGSITKIPTAIAVLQGVERGDLALEDHVTEYVDFFEGVPGEPITVRELLTHTSGMPADFVAFRDTVADRTDLQLHVDGAADRRLTDRERFFYYNSGYEVLGELLVAIDGRSYPEYVREEVLDPLGMDRSTFDQAALEGEDATPGYTEENGEYHPNREPLEFAPQPAAGGLMSSVSELARLGRVLLAEGSLEGQRLLDEELAREMCRSQVQRRERLDGSRAGYGYGVMVDELLGERTVGHRGGVSVGRTYLGALRERQLGVAVAFNAGTVEAGTIGRGVLALAAGESPDELGRAVPEIGHRRKVQAATGTYEAYRGDTATVEADGARILVSIDSHEKFAAFPESAAPEELRFYTVAPDGGHTPVEFVETDDGMAMLHARARFDRVEG